MMRINDFPIPILPMSGNRGTLIKENAQFPKFATKQCDMIASRSHQAIFFWKSEPQLVGEHIYNQS